jgi:predicted anti-sigma-YlaC factor YlaD
MNDDSSKMSCVEFQAQMADMIGSGEDLSADPHLMNCEACRALLGDLKTIADAARQLFPVAEPPDQVWENIETAIRREKETASKAR